jgi:hypothetical protein
MDVRSALPRATLAEIVQFVEDEAAHCPHPA